MVICRRGPLWLCAPSSAHLWWLCDFCIWSADTDTNAYGYRMWPPPSFCSHEPRQGRTRETLNSSLGSQVRVLRLFRGLMWWPVKFRHLNHCDPGAQDLRFISYAGTHFCNLPSGFNSSSSGPWAVTGGKSIFLIVWYLLWSVVSCLFASLGIYCSSSRIGVVAALCLQLWAHPYFWAVDYTFSNYCFDERHIFCNESPSQGGQRMPL